MSTAYRVALYIVFSQENKYDEAVSHSGTRWCFSTNASLTTESYSGGPMAKTHCAVTHPIEQPRASRKERKRRKSRSLTAVRQKPDDRVRDDNPRKKQSRKAARRLKTAATQPV